MNKILGQPHALDVLRQALKSARLHHAWIFSGPRGVGKFTTAVEFAKILLDPEAAPNLAGAIESDPEGRISKMIDAESHPDLHVIRKELALYSDNPLLRARKLMNIPIDLLRERMIGGRTGDDKTHDAIAYRTASLGNGKVFIIDEAELIDSNGQNTLLKTLEEPPPRTYMFLITARPERLFATIRSRCQHVRFQPLDHESMQAWFAQSGLEVDAMEREWIERFADGAPGQAKTAAEFGFSQWQHTLDPMIGHLERGGYPAEMGKLMAQLVKDFSEAWVKSRKNASKDAANKDGARHLLAILAAYARRRLHESANNDEAASSCADLIDLVREAERQLETNVNLRHVMDNLVVQWADLGAIPVHS